MTTTSKTITPKAAAEAVGKALSSTRGSVVRLSGGQREADPAGDRQAVTHHDSTGARRDARPGPSAAHAVGRVIHRGDV